MQHVWACSICVHTSRCSKCGHAMSLYTHPDAATWACNVCVHTIACSKHEHALSVYTHPDAASVGMHCLCTHIQMQQVWAYCDTVHFEMQQVFDRLFHKFSLKHECGVNVTTHDEITVCLEAILSLVQNFPNHRVPCSYSLSDTELFKTPCAFQLFSLWYRTVRITVCPPAIPSLVVDCSNHRVSSILILRLTLGLFEKICGKNWSHEQT